eukprot:scaffold247965_cov42-Prasinocladus_malaysianus.AAC.1
MAKLYMQERAGRIKRKASLRPRGSVALMRSIAILIIGDELLSGKVKSQPLPFTVGCFCQPLDSAIKLPHLVFALETRNHLKVQLQFFTNELDALCSPAD